MPRTSVPLLCALIALGCGGSRESTTPGGSGRTTTTQPCPQSLTRERFGLPLDAPVPLLLRDGESLYVAGGFGLLRSTNGSFARVGAFRHVTAVRAFGSDRLLVASNAANELSIATLDGTITQKCRVVGSLSSVATDGKRIVTVDVAGSMMTSTNCTHWTPVALPVFGVTQVGANVIAWSSTRAWILGSNGQFAALLAFPKPIMSMLPVSSTALLVTASDGDLLFDLRTGTFALTGTFEATAVTSSDGTAYIANSGVISVFDLETASVTTTLMPPDSEVSALSLRAGSLVAGSARGLFVREADGTWTKPQTDALVVGAPLVTCSGTVGFGTVGVRRWSNFDRDRGVWVVDDSPVVLTGAPDPDGTGRIIRAGYSQIGEPPKVWCDDEVILKGVLGGYYSDTVVPGPVVVRAVTAPAEASQTWVLISDRGSSLMLNNVAGPWRDDGLPAARVYEVAVDDLNPQHLVVLGENARMRQLFETFDGSINWRRMPLSADGILQLGFLNGELAILRETGLWLGSRNALPGHFRELSSGRRGDGEYVLLVGGDDGLQVLSRDGVKTLVDEQVTTFSVDRSAFAAVVASGAVVVGPVE